MPPTELLRQASQRLAWPEMRHGRPARQLSLRATLDWSWSLLSAAERTALMLLSTFEGGFTLEATQAVIAPEITERSADSVETVHSLVEKSLVRLPHSGRLGLLGAVKDYAADVLAARPEDAETTAFRRHAGHFAALARNGQAGLDDLPNLSVATRRMCQAGEQALALDNLEGAWELLKLRGPFTLVLELATEVGGMDGLGDAERARVERVLGWACKSCGQGVEAERHLHSAVAHARSAGDAFTEAYALSLLGDIQVNRGELGPAEVTLGQALDVALATGSATLACEARTMLANRQRHLGDTAAAVAQYEAALVTARNAGLRRWEGGSLGNLGMLAAEMGRLAEADQLCGQALTIARELGDRQWEANTLCNLGLLHHLQRRTQQAADTLLESLGSAQELGHARLQGIVLCNLGIVMDELQQPQAAWDHYQAALELARNLSDKRTEAQVLGYLGGLHARQGRFDQARQCLAEGLVQLEAIGDRASLGILHCTRAECEALAGQATEAAIELAAAEAIAQEIGAEADSELRQALLRVRGLA